MKSTLITIIYLLTQFLFSNTQIIRFTTTGRQCVFPTKYNGIEYKNCIINEKGQEWCYIDKLGISWNFCARGDFKIDSSVLIKNIKHENSNNKTLSSYLTNNKITFTQSTNFCLFNDIYRKKIFAIDCSILLQLKKYKIDKSTGLDTNNFEFFWINHNQIKTKETQQNKCLHPVETPIIEENKIAYTGYIHTKECSILEDQNKNNEQKWKIDENGRILNEYSKRCMVRSNEFSKFSEAFRDVKLDSDYEIYAVNLGDCLGNAKGFQGREIWLLDEFRPELLELMALEKLMSVYNEGNKKMEEIDNGSNKNFLKLISYNTNLIGHKRILDGIENKLETEEMNLKNFNLENDKRFNFYQGNDNLKDGEPFNVNGVLFKICRDFELPPEKILISKIPLIVNSEISVINFLDIFNEVKYNYFRKEKSRSFNIDKVYKVLKISGFLIYKVEKFIKIKVKSNTKFMFTMNSRIVFNSHSEEEFDATSESFKILSKSLNEFSIIIQNSSIDKKLNFQFDIIHVDSNSNRLIELSASNFIPIIPGKTFTIKKTDFLNDLQIINCKDNNEENLQEIIKTKADKSYFYCDTLCLDHPNSICSRAFKENKLTPTGGLIDIYYNKDNKLEFHKFDFNMLAIDLVITEVKLGYVKELIKFTEDNGGKSSKLKNYVVRLNPHTHTLNSMKEDESFLFYKKSIPSNMDDFIIINAKLFCDNSVYNPTSESINGINNFNKIKVEKIHDMLNGFSIWLYKIKYKHYLKLINTDKESDYFDPAMNKKIPFVDDLNLSIFSSSLIKNNYEEMQNKFNTENKNNKFVCQINNKRIILQVKFKSNTEPIKNVIDFNADFNSKYEDLEFIYSYDNYRNYLGSLVIKCSDNNNTSSNLEKVLDINERYKLICISAYEKGLITKTGGVFKLVKNKNKSVELEGVNGIPSIKIFQKNYRTFTLSDELLKSENEFIKNIKDDNMKNKFSSFLENASTESSEALTSSKFYSNDLLLKLELGLNRITDKIIEGSKRISDVTKINEDLDNKIKKIEVGENSLDVISKRIEEISKLETNLEDRVNKKFLKYREMLNDKDKKIKELNINHNPSCRINLKYDLQQRGEEFYSDWLIVDSLNSINGPSDWDIKLNDLNGRYSIIQNSLISVSSDGNSKDSKETLVPSSSLIFKNFSFLHFHSFYSKITFQTKSFGLLQFNFRYKDYQNYIAIKFERKSKEEGFIKLIQVKQNQLIELENLSCDKMLTVLEKCYGYHADERENAIEMLLHEEILKVKYNKYLIFHLPNFSENFDDHENFVMSINNQNSLIISDFILRELNSEEKFEMTNKDIKSKFDINKNRNFSSVKANDQNSADNSQANNSDNSSQIKANQPEDNKKQNLKYNPLTNKFEIQIESAPSNSDIQNESKKNLSVFEFNKDEFKQKCLKYEKEEYVCNYITKVISSNEINIKEISVVELVKIIRSNCISMMKNEFLCDQIRNKLEPVLHKLKDEIAFNASAFSKNFLKVNEVIVPKMKEKFQIKREFSNLIKSCSFEFLPNLLKNRKICLNEIMMKEIQLRMLNKNDECVKEFCINCCYINYGNPSCKVCE